MLCEVAHNGWGDQAFGFLQGEMIQAKFGLVAVAERQLETYSTAVLLATESPPKPPRYVARPWLPPTLPAHVSLLSATALMLPWA